MAWGTQRERGYTTLIVVDIEGIPSLWVERPALRPDDDLALAVPSGRNIEPALVVTESSIIDWQLDRETGIASGRALDIDLDLDAMTSTGAGLFRRPTKKARLTSDILSAATTTFNVDSTTGWASSGAFWAGREYVTYSGTTATSFTGCTRGVAGLVHPHIANGVSGYSYATDRPIYWRGRFVTVWAHLVAPDGRLLSSTWLDGEYARPLWRGYIDAVPQVTSRMVRLRALPLERRLTAGLGTQAEGEVLSRWRYRIGGGGFPRPEATIYATEADKLVIVRESDGETVQVPISEFGPTTPERWGQQAMDDAATYFGGGWSGSANVASAAGTDVAPYWFRVMVPDGYRVESRAWFIGEMLRDFDYSEGVDTEMWRGRFLYTGASAWVFLYVTLDVVGRPQSWPSTGFGLLQSGDVRELVGWDSVDTTYETQGVVAVRLSQRQLANTPLADPWAGDARITALAGHVGTATDCLRTLVTSSGTGARGAFDTLPPGYGYGIPDDWCDFDDWPFNALVVEAIGEGGSSVEDLLGGWVALHQFCIAQTYRDGALKLRLVPTTVLDGAGLPTLVNTDVVLGTVNAEGLIESPNAVNIDRSTLLGDGDILRIQDVPRVQAEDARAWEIRVPGIDDAPAVGLAVDMLALSDGQQAVRIGVRPGFAEGLGSLLRFDAEHPAVYDWGTGATATDELARVVGYSESLWSGDRDLTLLLPGQSDYVLPLCPSAQIVSRPSATEIVIAIEDVVGFAAGYRITAYVAGSEDTLKTDRIIDGITTTTTQATITLTASLSTTDYPVGAWLTYIDTGFGNAEQDRHLYYGAAPQEFR